MVPAPVQHAEVSITIEAGDFIIGQEKRIEIEFAEILMYTDDANVVVQTVPNTACWGERAKRSSDMLFGDALLGDFASKSSWTIVNKINLLLCLASVWIRE